MQPVIVCLVLVIDMQQVVGISTECACGLHRLDAHGTATLGVTHALLPALLPLLAPHARTGVHCGQAAPHFERKRLAHQCMCRCFAAHLLGAAGLFHHFAGSAGRTLTSYTFPN